MKDGYGEEKDKEKEENMDKEEGKREKGIDD